MRIHSAEIHNFRSIKKQKIRFLPHVNVLIGKNNAGKTNIIKSIEMFFHAIDSIKIEEPAFENLITQDDWYLLQMKKQIIFEFKLMIETKDVLDILELLKKTYKKTSQMSTKELKLITDNFEQSIDSLNIPAEGAPLLNITREFRYDSNSGITSQIKSISIADIELFNEKLSELTPRVFSHKTKSGYRKYKIVENPIIQFGNELLKIVQNEFCFTSPTKEKLTKQPRDNLRNDIANRLYNRHIRRRVSGKYRDLKSELENLPFMDGEFRPSLNEDQQEKYAELMIDVTNDLSLPIEYFGEGLQSALNILDNIIFFNGGIVAIEEPENSLHPSGQRYVFELLKVLSQDYNKQIIITSHSSVFIDRSKDTRLFRVSLINRRTIVDIVEEPDDIVRVLDDLGFKPSYALLSNGVVWVEGPSDRAYIKHWLELYGVNIDDIGISILPYGGSNLDHLTVEDFMMLNRNFILIMDSERKKAGGIPQGYKRKKELKDKIEEVGNIAWITKKRAIDNYVPSRVIKEKYGFKTFTVNAYKRLSEQVRLAADVEGIECSYQKVRDSPDLARLMTRDDLIQSEELNTEIGKIAYKVKEWIR